MSGTPITRADVQAEIDKVNAAHTLALVGVAKIAGKYFAQQARGLFDNNPALESFGWHQEDNVYNDETYEFQVSREQWDITVNGETHEEVCTYQSGEKGGYGKYVPRLGKEDLLPLFDKVVDFLAPFDEDEFRIMFGDYANVTIDRNGATIN